MVVAVGDEIAQPFELPGRFGGGPGEVGFEPGPDHAPRLGIEVVAIGLAVAVVVRIGNVEQAIVEPDFGSDGAARVDPVDRAFDLAVRARAA